MFLPWMQPSQQKYLDFTDSLNDTVELEGIEFRNNVQEGPYGSSDPSESGTSYRNRREQTLKNIGGSMNRKVVFCAVVCCLLMPGSILAAIGRLDQKDDATISVRVRDSRTGVAIPNARVEIIRERGPRINSLGSGTVAATPNENIHITISAEKYTGSESQFVAGPGMLPVTFLLDPIEEPEELRSDVVAAKLDPQKALIHGHVIDSESGTPIAGATVRLRQQHVTAKSDQRGYFSLLAAALPYNMPDDVPLRDDIIVEANDHRTFEILNAFLPQGADTHYIVELQRGSGVDTRDDIHKLQRANPYEGDDTRFSDADLPPAEVSAQGLKPIANSVPLPTNIRLGTNCSCASCSSVLVLARGTYVKRGLNDEWIASWHINALRAGAVAYRSYGCYYAQHPISSNYDICNNACCQVNDSDTSTSTNQAVDDTSGVVVTRDCAHPAKAYYAAEQNHCAGCGNGYAGAPASNWPCITDMVDINQSCNGHGLGACQWGTQRHAVNNGWAWTTIVDHYYYNGGGNRNAKRSNTCP